MKFKVLNTEPPEQTLRCPRCNNMFRTDPNIQMNLVLINNVLLPQCPACKTIEDAPNFNMLLREFQKKWIEDHVKAAVEEYLKEDRMNIKLISKFIQKANERLPSGLMVSFAPAYTVGLYKGQDMIAAVSYELIEDNFDYALEVILGEAKKEAEMKFETICEEFPDLKVRCPSCYNIFWLGFLDTAKNAHIIKIKDLWHIRCPQCSYIEDNYLKFQQEVEMNIKDCTRTVDGTPVKIYEVYEDKTHGAYFDNEEWLIAVWNADGQNVIPCYKKLDLDLSDWKDEIPWDCLRPEIKVVARDDDGRWFGYLEEPELKMDGQYKIWRSEFKYYEI